jgi:uncharacterized protein (DUF433 family)
MRSGGDGIRTHGLFDATESAGPRACALTRDDSGGRRGPCLTHTSRSPRKPSALACASIGRLPPVDLSKLIDVRPGVRSGKPCFVGTRIAVYDVLEYLASGMTHEEIVADFPELTEAHIRAALEFAALRERRLATPA